MRSSSTEPRGTRFLPVGTGAWVRLALVAGLGVAALAGPDVDRTGALYTDVETFDFTLEVPAPELTETAPETPTDATVEEGAGAEAGGPAALQAPAVTALRAASPDLAVADGDPAAAGTPAPAAEPTPTPDATPTPEATPTPTTTPDPAVTQPPSAVPTPWLPGPGKHKHGR